MADWCRFSQMLSPIWLNAAKMVKDDSITSDVIIAAMDDDDIPAEFRITKYPTIKLFRSGEMSKREYRGERSVNAIYEYVKEQQKTAWVVLETNEEFVTAEKSESRPSVFGFFKDDADVNTFRVLAEKRRDECAFHFGFSESATESILNTLPFIFFRSKPESSRSVYMGNAFDQEQLDSWLSDVCNPLVKEITFQNGEELAEQGLPFLILFYDPEDDSSKRDYTRIVTTQLKDVRSRVQFLTADGVLFAHPLQHLGKAKKDLPVLAIDSFRHMYDFGPVDFGHGSSNRLRSFIDDLESGALHHKLHHPSEPVKDSKFQAIAPSEKRYSFIRDEL